MFALKYCFIWQKYGHLICSSLITISLTTTKYIFFAAKNIEINVYVFPLGKFIILDFDGVYAFIAMILFECFYNALR